MVLCNTGKRIKKKRPFRNYLLREKMTQNQAHVETRSLLIKTRLLPRINYSNSYSSSDKRKLSVSIQVLQCPPRILPKLQLETLVLILEAGFLAETGLLCIFTPPDVKQGILHFKCSKTNQRQRSRILTCRQLSDGQ